MNRRGWLAVAVHSVGAMVGAVVAIPAMITALSPLWERRPREQWQPVGPLDEFPLQRVRPAVVDVPRDDWDRSLRVKEVFVWRPSDEEVVVYSRNCTDLSCPLILDAGSQCFLCPCHGGIFDRDGSRLAGPPNEPMFRYANRVRDGVLEIDLYSLPPMT